MSDAEPSVVADRYRLDERIGGGPMGEVWRGYDTRADWVVAVKVLGARAAGAATREVLRQHARSVAKVIHPNVAMVLDVGEHDGAPFLVMEYLTGTSLGEELAARGRLRIVEVCDLIGQAAAGLDAAHRAGVVHGRIGPGSFRMASSGVLKVVGFGLDEHEPVREDDPYAAPERAGGQAARAPGDVYALGCVAYELLCGQPPSETPDGRAPGQDVRGGEGRLVPPSAIRAEVPPELDRLLMAMLAPDPAQRPTSGEAIRRTLAAIARPKPAPAGPPVTGVSLRDPGLQAGMAGAGMASAGMAGPGMAGPGMAGPGMAGPGMAGPGMAGPGMAGPGMAGSGVGPGGVGPGGGGVGGGNGGSGATEVLPVGVPTGPGHAPRAGDTAVYAAGDYEPEPDQGPNRKMILQLGVACVVIAAVTVGMVMLAGAREEEPVAVPTPDASPTALVTFPTSPSPSATEDENPFDDFATTLDPEAEPDALIGTAAPKGTLGQEIPPGGYGEWLRRFDENLTLQQSMGGIDPKVADKARDQLQKAARRHSDGNARSTVHDIAGVYRDLARAQQKGEMGAGPASEFMQEWQLPAG
ncbi:protein kinase [Nonomuraea sp. NPDC050404]|uniref:protein kinase domain-containing protein n=1 Tax=Nonomuraea sp. NPDC050404 TaxID=3155783 RepID=UPI00340A458B